MDQVAILNLIFCNGVVLFTAIWLLRRYLNLNLIIFLFIALLLHDCAAIFYWYQSINGMTTDSNFYFHHANPTFGFTYQFATFYSYYMRALFWGDSYLAAFIFSSGIGFLGGVFFTLSFFEILTKFKIKLTSAIFLPLLLILFWPTHLFFTVAICKDSLSYFGIAFISYAALSIQRKTLVKLVAIVCIGLVLFMVRPYLLLLFSMSVLFSQLFASKLALGKKVMLLFLGVSLMAFILIFLHSFAHLNLSFEGVAKRALANQVSQAIGTNIPVPTHNIYYMPLFLPYLFLANLFLPLFIFAHNAMAILASFENLVLLYLCYYGFKRKRTVLNILKAIPVLSVMFFFSINGILFLGLINTNLGLAMREKVMYVPILILIVCVLLTIEKTNRAYKAKNFLDSVGQ